MNSIPTKPFRVVVRASRLYFGNVEAASQDEAEDLARLAWEQDELREEEGVMEIESVTVTEVPGDSGQARGR